MRQAVDCWEGEEFRSENEAAGGKSSSTQQPGHPPTSHTIPPHIHHLQETIIPSENTTLPAEPPLCLRGAARKRLSAHRCVIGENLPASLCNFFFIFQSKTFKSFSLPMHQNIKTEMSSPLSGDNFPWVKPIEHYSAVSNLSGKVLERYSRTLDAPCLVACEIWRRDSVQQLHYSTPPALFFFFLHVNGESVRVSWSSANSSGVC